MGSNPYAAGPLSSSTSANPYATSGSSGAHHPHGVGGFLENLATDVTKTAAGIPTGFVHLAEHPIGSIEGMGKATWQTWSPLFHGHVGTFAHNFYEHPLAPILDVASLLSLGVGSVAKAGALMGASADAGGVEGLLGKAALLREPKRIMLQDPLAKNIESGRLRTEVPFNYSTKPARRLMQEHVMPAAFHKLPSGMQDSLRATRYQQKLYGHMAHQAIAKSAVLGSVLKAAQLLHDPQKAFEVRRKLAMHLWGNLWNNGRPMTHEEARAYLMSHPHDTLVRDPLTWGGPHHELLANVRSIEKAQQRLVEKHGPRANALASLEAELARHEADLAHMQKNGYRIAQPAKTKLKEPTPKQLMERNAAPIVEKQRTIKMLRKQITKARKSKAIYDAAKPKYEAALSARHNAERRAFAAHFEAHAASPESFDKFANNFGKYGTVAPRKGSTSAATVDAALAKAMHDGSGMVRVVPKHDAANLGRELSNSTGMLSKIFHRPTVLWKAIQVRWTPRTLTNNGVGNALLYMLRQDPATSAMGLWHASKILKGARTAGEDFMKSLPGSNRHWFWRHFAPELHNVFGADALNTTGRLRLLKSGFAPLVHKLVDEPIRTASIVNYVRHDPVVQDLMRKGMPFDEAAARGLRGQAGRALRERAIAHARSVAGDYQALTPLERKINNVAPFYTWDRHAVRSAKNIVAENPTLAAALQQTGQQGANKSEQILGALPEYLQGALPLQMLGLGGGAGDRVNILTTKSLNPFSTVGDLAQLGQALTVGHNINPGNSLFGQVNPLATGVLNWAAQKNVETGGPLQNQGGAVTTMLSNLAENFPEYKLVQGLIQPPQTLTKKGKPKVLASNKQSAITSFLGVPVRGMSKSAATAAALKERKVKKRTNPYA